MTALHVFDMDGTPLRGTTASLRIASAYGGELAGLAAVSYRGDDLTEAYALGRARLP